MVRFHDRYTESEFDEVDYGEILFRGEQIIKERMRLHRENMVVAAFNAWQIVSPQLEKPPTWKEYLKNMGLSDEKKATKEDLEREVRVARENVRRIMEKAKNGCRKGTI